MKKINIKYWLNIIWQVFNCLLWLFVIIIIIICENYNNNKHSEIIMKIRKWRWLLWFLMILPKIIIMRVVQIVILTFTIKYSKSVCLVFFVHITKRKKKKTFSTCLQGFVSFKSVLYKKNNNKINVLIIRKYFTYLNFFESNIKHDIQMIIIIICI